MSFADLGGEILDATLESIGRVAGKMDGTYGIELWMSDDRGVMRDGMVAQIELPNPEAEPRLLARRAALLRRDGHPEVFIVEGQGEQTVARTRRLRTGRSQGDWVEVLDGLSEGDRVIWDGHFALADGTPVIIDGAPTSTSTPTSTPTPAPASATSSGPAVTQDSETSKASKKSQANKAPAKSAATEIRTTVTKTATPKTTKE